MFFKNVYSNLRNIFLIRKTYSIHTIINNTTDHIPLRFFSRVNQRVTLILSFLPACLPQDPIPLLLLIDNELSACNLAMPKKMFISHTFDLTCHGSIKPPRAECGSCESSLFFMVLPIHTYLCRNISMRIDRHPVPGPDAIQIPIV